MVLLGAVLMPHGTMPYDGDEQSPSPAVKERRSRLDPAFRDDLSQLYHKTCEMASAVAALQADLYILHTPHGISLSDAYGVYSNTNAGGNALWLGQWSEFEVSVTLDEARAKELKDLLVASGIDSQMISAYGGYEDIVFRWGEVVPVWYLQKYITNAPKYLVVSQDLQRCGDSVEDWRLRIGRELASFAESLEEKVVVVFSGDLSHCHPTTCTDPLYMPSTRGSRPFPYNKEAAEAFDDAVAAWVQSQDEQRWDSSTALKHLDTAVKLQPDALSCAVKGLVVLHGMLAEFSRKGIRFRSHVAVRKVPTYYGMMAASFLRN